MSADILVKTFIWLLVYYHALTFERCRRIELPITMMIHSNEILVSRANEMIRIRDALYKISLLQTVQGTVQKQAIKYMTIIR